MFLALLFACRHGGDDGPGEDDAKAVDDDPAPQPAGGPTYYADVRPILDRACARCHTTSGVAPSFDAPEDVVVRAAMIRDYTQAGIMPPPAPDPTCADYVDSERLVLSDADKAVLAAWADGGAPLGDPADAPAAVPPFTTAPFDAVIQPAEPYVPAFDADGNTYRCFSIALGNAAPTYLTGMEAVVDNPSIVHHVVLSLDRDGSSPTDPDGYDCSGLGEANWAPLGAWGPNTNPLVFPDGLGLPLPANARLILQMHYYNGGDADPDRTGVGLHLADHVDHALNLFILGSIYFTIPAGDPDYTATSTYTVHDDGYTILGVWPHMHVLGKAFSARVLGESGAEDACLVRWDDYTFENQVMVQLRSPYVAHEGERIEVSCTWDNSADNPNQLHDPPEDVHFGEETGDEMCFAFTYGYLP